MPDIEVLAPVGNRAMLNAALAAGADAVYLGGKIGSARAFAGNFSLSELQDAVQDAHLQGTRVYLTLNTLVKNQEMDELLRFADAAILSDIDAIILQDLGLARALRARYPALSLHASTQMNVNSLAGVLALEALGFERIIAGRETSLEELERMRDHSDMEVELFVHGSLCVSWSGQCLLSGLIGGRSGNRGRCAQPCRKRYRTPANSQNTLLSLRDLNTLDFMDTWRKLKICSLKIEGRMKKPEYVYAVTKMVKAAIRGEPYATDLLDVSSRSFTKGFTLGDFGRSVTQTEEVRRGSVIGSITENQGKKAIRLQRDIARGDTLELSTTKGKILPITATHDSKRGALYFLDHLQDAKTGSPVHRVYGARIAAELESALGTEPSKIPVEMEFSGKIGQYATLIVRSRGFQEEIQSESIVEKARQNPVGIQDIRLRLEKVGNTRFEKPHIAVQWEDESFLPLGEVNRMRRTALEAVRIRFATWHNRQQQKEGPVRKFFTTDSPALHLEIDNNAILATIPSERIHRIYTSDWEGIPALREKWNCPIFGILPEPADRETESLAENIHALFDGFLVKDLAGYYVAKSYHLPVQLDTSVHCMNDRSADLLLGLGKNVGITASLEMSGVEMEKAAFISAAEVVAFGPTVAMKLHHCPFSVEKNCSFGADCTHCNFSRSSLTDEQGERYYVERKDGVSYLYFSHILDRIDGLGRSRVHPKAYRLILREDNRNDTIIEYAFRRLIEKKNAIPLEMKGYWHMSDTTQGRWREGME